MSLVSGRVSAATAASAAVLLGLALVAPGQAVAQNKNIVIVLSGEPDSLDGCNASRSVTGRVVKQNINETLVEIDPKDGALKPRLATSWEKVNDTTWRFKLRQGVSFTDGSPFNAQSLTKSISRLMDNKDLPCENRTKRFGDLYIKGVPVDDFTIDIVSNKPDPIVPTRMTVVTIDSPKTATDKLVWDPVGTGPYVLDHFTPGQEAVLKRNDKYWGKKPEVDQAKYVWRNESAVRAAMVKLGEADLTDNIAYQDVNDPKTDFSFLNSETTYGRIDTTQKPLDDRRIRLALNYAMDRKAIVGSIFSKDVVPAAQVVFPAVAGHNHELDKKIYPYDQAKARQLIAEAKAAGTPVDKEIQLLGRIGYYPNVNEFGEALQAMYTAVGLNAKLIMMESAQWSKFNNKPFPDPRAATILLHQHDNNNGDPVFSVFSKYSCDGNSSGQCNPDLDKLIASATALSGVDRVKAWNEVFRFIYEETVSDIFMFHMVGYTRVGNRINFVPNVSINSEIPIADITFK